jgi:hypothetical protein
MKKNPIIVKDIFSKEDFENLESYLLNLEKTKESFDAGFGRFHHSSNFLDSYAKKILPLAKKIFGKENLKSSYTLFAHYEGQQANLWKHKDDNACTYTLDFCVYQTDPWDIWVENVPYTLNPNEALAFWGEEQEHWREAIPDPENQKVAMLFFHFVEEDHWFFSKGPGYIDVIRGEITEEDYIKNKG